VIGTPGEDPEPYRPKAAAPASIAAAPSPAAQAAAPRAVGPAEETHFSPRARRFAAEHDFHPEHVAGSGPGGRVLEADLVRLYRESPRLSYLARRQAAEGRTASGSGSGINGLVRAADLADPAQRLSGVREKIARRMRESLQSTAQYTLHASAAATGRSAAARCAILARGTEPRAVEKDRHVDLTREERPIRLHLRDRRGRLLLSGWRPAPCATA
jgi:pyruvate dehydrogenase E2 component (dihydrolipoamide acetyltransferase)